MRPHLIRGGAYPSGSVEPPVDPPPDPSPSGGYPTSGNGTPGQPLGMGMNATYWWAYGPALPFRDLVKAAYGFHITGVSDDYSPSVAIDANGWPNADFRFRPQAFPTNSTPNGTIYCSFKGKTTNGASDLHWVTNAGITLNTGSWTYDSGTNTTTFNLTFVSLGAYQPWGFELLNTHKDNAAAANTGIADLKMSRPPYTLADLETGLYTAEYLALNSRYKWIRPMHSNGGLTTRNTTTWASRPTPENTRAGFSYNNPADPGYHDGYPLEYFITLANECNNSMWVNLPTRFTDDYATGLATLIKDTLNPGKIVYYEIANENWLPVPGCTAYDDRIKGGLADCKGILLPYTYYPVRGVANDLASRDSSGVLTLTFPLGHYQTNGDKIYPIGFPGIVDGTETTVTVIDANHISMPTTITTAGTVIFGSTGSARASGPLTNNLRFSASRTADPMIDYYAMTYRWIGKRAAELGALLRSVYGDVQYNAYHRVVLSDQSVNGGSAATIINYVSNKFTSFPVNHYIQAISGAPYLRPLPIRQTAGVTVDQLVTAWQQNLAVDEIKNYCYEGRAMHARWFGLKSVCYEFGLDSQWDAAQGSTSTDRNNRNRASVDSRLKDYIKTNVLEFWKYGNGETTWFDEQILDQGLADDAPTGCFALRISRTDETTAKIAATNELITTNYPSAQGRQTIPGNIDIRAHIDNFPPYAETAPIQMTLQFGSDFTGSALDYATWCDTPGTYVWTVSMACWQSIPSEGRSWEMWHNGVKCGATMDGPLTNAGGYLNFSNPINVSRNIVATAGWNDFRIRMTGSDKSPIEYGFWAMSVT
jgi:hypothetical protein